MASHEGIGGRNDLISAPPDRCASCHAKSGPAPGTREPVVRSAMRIPGGLVMTFIVDGLQRPVSTVSISLGVISLLYRRSRRRNTL
jgi:hypothetical protein